MFKFLLLAGTFVSCSALAAQDCDIRSSPSTIEGDAPTHIDGNDNGRPIIHRQAIPTERRVSNGVARQDMGSGENERTITRGGRGRGTFGSRSSPIIVTNEDGRPQLRYAD